VTPPLLLYIGQDAPVLAVNTARMGVTTPCTLSPLNQHHVWSKWYSILNWVWTG